MQSLSGSMPIYIAPGPVALKGFKSENNLCTPETGLLQYSNTCIKPKILLATWLYKNSVLLLQ